LVNLLRNQSRHSTTDHRVSASVVDERIDHVTRRRSINDPLDRDRIGNDDHEKHGNPEAKLARTAHFR